VPLRRREVEHVGHEPVDSVGGEASRRIGTHARGIAALIGGDRVIAGRAEGGHLLPPGVARLGIAVEQEHERTIRRSRHLGGELSLGSLDGLEHTQSRAMTDVAKSSMTRYCRFRGG